MILSITIIRYSVRVPDKLQLVVLEAGVTQLETMGITKSPDFSETVFQIEPKEFHADSRKTKLYTNLLRIVGRDYKQRIYVVTHRNRRFIL